MNKVSPSPAGVEPCALEDIYELAAAARDDGGNPQHRPEEQWFRYNNAGMICLWEPQNRSGTKRISHWWVREDRRDEEIGPALLDRAIETAVESEGSRLDIYVYDPAPVEARGFRPATGGNARDEAQYYERDISESDIDADTDTGEQSTGSSRSTTRSPIPRATIHKRILDEAAAQPDAPMAKLADRVSGASLELVEKVLDEYGDPADDRAEPPPSQEQPASEQESLQEEAPSTHEAAREDSKPEQEAVTPSSEASIVPRDGSLAEPYTTTQIETLRLIHEHPEASQHELGEQLGVSASAISNRLSEIRGFDWNTRREFVTPLFAEEQPAPTADQPDRDPMEDLRQDIADLEHRVEAIETHIKHTESDRIPLELAHKVIRVCIESDQLTSEEELRLIHELIGT